MEAKGLGYFNH